VTVWISQTHYGVRLIAATGDQEDFVTTIVGLLVLVAYVRVPRAAVVDAAIQSLDVKVESDDQVRGTWHVLLDLAVLVADPVQQVAPPMWLPSAAAVAFPAPPGAHHSLSLHWFGLSGISCASYV
jgi:hypothetical protein